jgi:small neutral amino acid transporter SnatA (MarC family)
MRLSLLNPFLIAFSALLPLINPLGSALVLFGLVGDAPVSVYRSLARKIAINNIIFLTIIELLGVTILNFFGISLPIVQFAGGIVIAAMGWSVLNERDARANSRNKQEETEERDAAQAHDFEQEVFYPFTFPITSGPGTLVALITVTAHNSSHEVSKNIPKDHEGHTTLHGARDPAGGCVHLAVYRCPDRLERAFGADSPGDECVGSALPTSGSCKLFRSSNQNRDSGLFSVARG